MSRLEVDLFHILAERVPLRHGCEETSIGWWIADEDSPSRGQRSLKGQGLLGMSEGYLLTYPGYPHPAFDSITSCPATSPANPVALVLPAAAAQACETASQAAEMRISVQPEQRHRRRSLSISGPHGKWWCFSDLMLRKCGDAAASITILPRR